MKSCMPLTERRRFERRTIKLAVSFSLENKIGSSYWYLGWICNAGLGGICVDIHRQHKSIVLQRSQHIKLLCSLDFEKTVISEELVRINGRIAWYDRHKGRFGMQYI